MTRYIVDFASLGLRSRDDIEIPIVCLGCGLAKFRLICVSMLVRFV